MNETSIPCLDCDAALPLASFLDGCTSWFEAAGTLIFNCPSCDEKSAVALANGEVRLGYIYASGEVHFSQAQSIAVPMLSVDRDGGALVARIGEKIWRFECHPPS